MTMMVNKLRFKPSLLFSGRQSSISEAAAIQSKLRHEASSVRCYAAFNFVADSTDSSSVKKITLERPLAELLSKTTLQRQSPAPSRHGVQVHQKLKCFAENYHSNDDDNDDFAELGSPVPNMHKPSVEGEPNNKHVPNKTEKAGNLAWVSSSPGKVKSSTSIPPKQKIDQPGFCFNLEDRYAATRTKTKSEVSTHVAVNNPSHNSSNCVIIDRVPSSISISLVREAMSVFGLISNAFMRSDQNGSKRCRIEFKTVGSSEKALAAKRVTIKNFHLEIRSPYVPKIFTIRISNISIDTAEPTIHSICMSCGAMKGLWRARDGHVYVLFCIKDPLDMQMVLKKLNDVELNGCQWLAQKLCKSTTTLMVGGSDEKQGVGLQISNLISGLKEQLQLKKIYLEDLENLHHAILHLKECPSY